jgi:hypothetical protein
MDIMTKRMDIMTNKNLSRKNRIYQETISKLNLTLK